MACVYLPGQERSITFGCALESVEVLGRPRRNAYFVKRTSNTAQHASCRARPPRPRPPPRAAVSRLFRQPVPTGAGFLSRPAHLKNTESDPPKESRNRYFGDPVISYNTVSSTDPGNERIISGLPVIQAQPREAPLTGCQGGPSTGSRH